MTVMWLPCYSEKDAEVSLDAELSLHEDTNAKKWKRGKFKRLDPDVLPECRVMSLTCFPLSEVYPDHDPNHREQDDWVLGRHYLAIGCSDAVIR